MNIAKINRVLGEAIEILNEFGGFGRGGGGRGRDPFWMKAKQDGVDKKGNKYKRGEEVFYYPNTRTILAGDDAKKASRDFDAAKEDERFMTGEDVELDEEFDLDDPIYSEKTKLRKYNVDMSPLSPGVGSDAGKMLRQRLPDWDKSKHLAASAKFASEAKKLDKEYSKELEDAAQETWGRPWRAFDYKISGIGSDEFSEERKGRLRYLAQRLTKAMAASEAHRYASKGIRIKK